MRRLPWLARRFLRDVARGAEFYRGFSKVEWRMARGELTAIEALKEIEALQERCRSRAL